MPTQAPATLRLRIGCATAKNSPISGGARMTKLTRSLARVESPVCGVPCVAQLGNRMCGSSFSEAVEGVVAVGGGRGEYAGRPD